MKRLFFILLPFLFVLGFVGAQAAEAARTSETNVRKTPYKREAEVPYWYKLEEGRKLFNAGDYANALIAFEDARDGRRDYWKRLLDNFISFMSISEVRRIGDDLDRLAEYMEERGHFDTAAALETLYFNVERDALNNSAKTAMRYFDLLKNYPEAEFYIGEIYRIEGEASIALSQYKKALAFSREGNPSPFFERTVLYKTAQVNHDIQNYQEMENTYTEILQNDEFWQNMRGAMSNTVMKNGLNKFLILYRHSNQDTESAHRELGFFHYKSGRYNTALEHLLFAALTQNTTIIDEARFKRYDFSFTTLDALAAENARNREVQKYIRECEYYKTLYYLAASLYANGSNMNAREIWFFLSSRQADAGEWAKRAAAQLKAPSIEKAIALP